MYVECAMLIEDLITSFISYSSHHMYVVGKNYQEGNKDNILRPDTKTWKTLSIIESNVQDQGVVLILLMHIYILFNENMTLSLKDSFSSGYNLKLHLYKKLSLKSPVGE